MDVLFYYYLSSLTFILSIGVFFTSPKLSSLISSKYLQLPIKDQINWNTRIASNIHAIIVTCISLYAFFFDEETIADPFCTESVIVRSGISVTFGYILADFLIILWYYHCFENVQSSVIHHLMVLLAYNFVIRHGYLLYFGNIRQIAELSTIFVNQRWFYDKIGQARRSKQFISNGLLMIFTFFLGRIIFIPYFYYKSLSVWSYSGRKALGNILSFLWIFSAGVLDILNIIWFSKMIQGCAKLLLYNKSRKTK